MEEERQQTLLANKYNYWAAVIKCYGNLGNNDAINSGHNEHSIHGTGGVSLNMSIYGHIHILRAKQKCYTLNSQILLIHASTCRFP